MLKKYKHHKQVSREQMMHLLAGTKQAVAGKCIPDGQYCDCTIPCCSSGNSCGIIPHMCGSGTDI